MKCTSCGAEIAEGVSFCTNCGTPVAADDAATTQAAVDAGPAASLGSSLENAVQANEEAMKPIEERTQAAFEAAQITAQEAAQAADQVFAADGAQPEASYIPPSNGAPEAPPSYQPQAAAGAAAAGAAASTPFYQKDVSPNAHYSSARSYEGTAYGQDTGQPGYREPGYTSNIGGGQAAAQQQTIPPQEATKRAYAMVLYVAGLIGLIFGLVVRDKDDEFITHHLNNVAVITIGALIGSLLTVVFIGSILLIYLFVMAIMGIISAYNGNMDELPLIGKIHIIK